jgi:hypothetical protein
LSTVADLTSCSGDFIEAFQEVLPYVMRKKISKKSSSISPCIQVILLIHLMVVPPNVVAVAWPNYLELKFL